MEVFEYPPRSIDAHNTEWLYYQIISDVTGHTAYEIYENMAIRILKTIDEDGDLAYFLPKSLNSYHHSLYIEQVKAIAASMDILLPDPTKDINLQYKTKKLKRR